MGPLPPGLAGFVAADQMRQQQQAAQLQQTQGLLGIQSGMADMAEKARVRGLMAQIPGVMERGDEKEIAGLLFQISPQTGAQYLLAKADNPAAGTVDVQTPEGPRVAIRTKRGDILPSKFAPVDTSHGTQIERALAMLRGFQQEANAHPGGPEAWAQANPNKLMEAQSARAILSQQRMAVDPVTQQPYWSQPMTVPPSLTVGGLSGGAPGGPAAIPGSGPARPGPVNALPDVAAGTGRKGLDANTESQFRKIGDGLQRMNMLAETFDPKFGGFVSETAGRAAIEAGRRLPDGVLNFAGKSEYKDHSLWWQNYEEWVTNVRAAAFGLTLTRFELQQFNRFRSHPGDQPDIIQRNLDRQRNIVNTALNRELSAVEASGQNAQQARALAGVGAGGGGGAAAPAGGYPAPPPAAIQRLKLFPQERELFEEKFGPGSATQYLPKKR